MSDINELRDYLFSALRGLKDGSIKIDQARAMSDVAQTIINTAKVEVEYLRVTGQDQGTGFVPIAKANEPPRIGAKIPTHTGTDTVVPGGVVHRMK